MCVSPLLLLAAVLYTRLRRLLCRLFPSNVLLLVVVVVYSAVCSRYDHHFAGTEFQDPVSLMNAFIHIASFVASAAATYSASQDDSATVFCLFADRDTGPPLIRTIQW
jgi:uncharacterized membrane protein (DUF4010 family)